MKKLERQKKAKQLAHAEEVERMKQAAAEKGQGFVEYELPPDEVDEDQVKRSLYTSIMTFIPYTNEYYEALAAEEEMDDLTKIRIEKVKASDLYSKTKTGHHEEALESMMAETNYDFFYFNKLKMKMEEEGKFKFRMPDNKSLFASLDSGPNRNRLRKAINQVYIGLDAKMTDELQRMGQVSSAGRAAAATRDYDGDEPCVWRGKNKSGDAMKCENHRFERPFTVDPSNPNRKKKKEFFQYCCYHVPFCVSDLHELGQSIKIKVPNSQALCAECFMLKNKKRPPPLTNDSAPGVVPVTLIHAKHMSKLTKQDGHDSDEERAKERARKKKAKKVKAANPNQCPWLPTPEELQVEPALRKFECCNDRHKDEATQFQHPFCIWHIRNCVRDHSNDETAMGLITVPNAYGLCMMHYLAEFHDKPPNPPFPFPGMKFRRKKDFWKHDPAHSHWALPRLPFLPRTHHVPPLADVFVREYIAPEPPETMVQKTGLWVKLQFYRQRLRKEGKHAATIVQKYFRGYRVRHMAMPLVRHIDAREVRARLFASVAIQSQMRRFLATKHVHELRARYNQAAKEIQRLYRGSVVRAYMRRWRAAKRIRRFMKRLHFFKFRDAVILIMSIRRMFRKRNATAMLLQRVYRGYRGRVFVFYQRLWDIINKSMLRVLRRALAVYAQRWRAWKKRQRRWVRPSDEALRARVAKRLGVLLTALVVQQKERRWQREDFVVAVQPMQALARGYLGRVGVRQLRRLRRQLTAWVAGDRRALLAPTDDAATTAPTGSAMELVLRLARQHRALAYTAPPHIAVAPAAKMTALLTFKHRQHSVGGLRSTRSSVSGLSVGGDTLRDAPASPGADTIATAASAAASAVSAEPGREFWFIRRHIPPPFCFWAEVDRKKHFLPALQRWYALDEHLSLMTSEQDALLARFTNRVNNKVMVEALDMYIAQHPLPCRRHGRRVCGTCAYRRHCLLPACHCPCYSNVAPPKTLPATVSGDGSVASTAALTLPTAATTHALGICVRCDHPVNMHAVCPRQYPRPVEADAASVASSSKKPRRPLKPTAALEAQLEFLDEDELRAELQRLRDTKNAAPAAAVTRVDPSGASVGSLLDVLRATAAPDMSLPVGVAGVAAADVLLPPLTYHDERVHAEAVAARQEASLQRLLRSHFDADDGASGSTAATTVAGAATRTTRGSALETRLRTGGVSAALASPVLQSLASSVRLRHATRDAGDGDGDGGEAQDTAAVVFDEVRDAAATLLRGEPRHLLVKELATLQLRGEDVARNSTYWAEDAMPAALRYAAETAPRPPPGADRRRTARDPSRRLLPVTLHTLPPAQAVDAAAGGVEATGARDPRFWASVVAKNPNKSPEAYAAGFEHNLPVPLLLPPRRRVGDAKTLAYSFEGGALYVNLLWQIVALADGVEAQFAAGGDGSGSGGGGGGGGAQRLAAVLSPDHPPFLALVMNHIQLFERHWRKMVVDVRTGTLDRRLVAQGSVTRDQQRAFEAMQVPRPLVAQQLDRCFRALGFHKKVLGKDIDIRPLAPRRTLRDTRRSLARVARDAKRLRGEAVDDGDDDGYGGGDTAATSRATTAAGGSRPATRGGGGDTAAALGSRPASRATATGSRASSPSATHRVALRDTHDDVGAALAAEASAAQESPSRQRSAATRRRRSLPAAVEADTASRPVTALLATSPPRDVAAASRGGSPSKPPATHQQATFAAAVAAFEPTNAAERALLRSSGAPRRRKSASQSETAGPAGPSGRGAAALSAEAVHAVHYDLVTDARDRGGYDTLVRLASTGRFLCPFPACGATFLSPDVGFRHLQQAHGQQTRLFAATPQTDAFLAAYWPRVAGHGDANPFQLAAKASALPPGSVACPAPACRGLSFATRAKWETHLRTVHHVYHLAHERQPFWAVAADAHHLRPAATDGDADGDANGNADGDGDGFHVTAAMQQQSFHRHGGARVLKTLPPDHAQPLFDDAAEAAEFDALARDYGDDVFARPLLVADDDDADDGATDDGDGASQRSGGGGASVASGGTRGRLAALKLRATRGFRSGVAASASATGATRGTAPRGSRRLVCLVQLLRHDAAQGHAGVGRRPVLPSYCATHAAVSGHCLACLHADADYDAVRDAALSAAALRARCDSLVALTRAGRSVYHARPHAPYELHYAWTLSLATLAQTLRRAGLDAAQATLLRWLPPPTPSSGAAAPPKWRPALLRAALSPQRPLCLLHGDDAHVLLVQRDLFTRHGVDIAAALPPALRPAAAGGGGGGGGVAEAASEVSLRLATAARWPAHFLVRPVFLVRDRDKLAWLGCEPVFLPQQLRDGDAFDVLTLTTDADATPNGGGGGGGGLRLFDRDTGDDLTPLLAASATHELLTATALLTLYDTRLADDAATAASFAGLRALLATPERLLWLPLHCVVAAFGVRYLPAPSAPPLFDADGAGDVPGSVAGGGGGSVASSSVSSYHSKLAAEEAAEAEEALPPLSRWRRRQEAAFRAMGRDAAADEQLVPAARDLGAARFFVRI